MTSALAAAAMVTPPAAAATSAGGLWHFNDRAGSTTASDASGNNNLGYLREGVVAGAPGAAGTAFDFRAESGAWVEVPDRATLNPGGRSFTYAASVRLDVAPPVGVTYDIVRKGVTTTAGGEFKLEVAKDGIARCTAKDANKLVASVSGPRRNVANGAWHRISCSRSATAFRITVDGVSRTKTVTLGSISNTRSLSIGAKYGVEDRTPGFIDEVQLQIVG
ncbi:MAG TPA: LamG-like jellyroll fold domain-containing protein [Marmoricola sp.]|nr:LamG-like jellyroll fold domain-containing protein [Marmoricola sp.]